MDKLRKVEAVYLPPGFVDKAGTSCGTCRDFIRGTSECVITIDPKVSGPRGTCTQYVKGTPHTYASPRQLVPKNVVGYIEGPEVPTYCGRCEYYGDPHKSFSPCAKVEGVVQFGGCCNLYQAKEEK